jgi:hypothetical protein
MLKSIAGQLLPIAKATAASGTDISGSLGGVNLAHLTPKITVTAEQAHQLALELEALGHAGHATTLKLKNATGEISLYSNLVANLPQPGNFDRLTGNQMAQWFSEEADFNGTKMTGMDSFLMPIAANYNIDPNDPELREFGNRLVASFLQAGNRAVTDTDIYQMVFEVINSMTESAARRAVVAASQEFRTVGDNSGDARRPSLPAGTFISAEADFVPGAKSLSATDASIRTDPLSSKGYRDIRSLPGMKEFVANSNQLADNFVTSLAQDIATEIESRGFPQIARVVADEVEDGLGISSPSAEYAGISNAVTAGVRTATDDAAAAGQEVGAAAARNIEAGATAGAPGVFRVPGSRRATTNPELAAMPAGTQTGGPRAPRRATAPQQAAGGPDQTGLMAADGMMLQIGASAGRASTEIDKLGETAKKGGVGLLGYGGIVSNLTFGATALAGAMSTVGGEVGAFGQEIFKISGFIFAATSIIQAFTQMKVLEIAATRAKIASDLAFGVAIGPKTAAQAATGFGATLARGAKFVTAFLGPIGLATIAIGVMVAGIYLVNKAREEEKARIEGLGKVANLAADKIQKLASIFGITPTPSPLDTATLVPGVSATERVEANEVRASEGFAEDYAAELNAIRTGAQRDVELALQFLTVKLSGMGFESEMIKTIVNALLLEAGRTDLNLEFNAIDLGVKGGIDQAIETARQAVADFEAAAVGGDTGKKEFALFDKQGVRIQNTPEDMKRAEEEGGITVQSTPIFTEEYLAKLNTLAQGLSGTVSGLSSAFANSTIGVEEFSKGMDGVSDAILGIEDEAARSSAFGSFLEGMRTEQNATFIDGLKKIAPTAEGIADSMLLIKAQAGGLELPPGIAEDFAAVSKGTATPAQIAAVNAMRAKANGILQQELTTQKGINDQVAIKKEMDADISTALTGLREQNAELENSNKAYEFLIDQGYSAADAFTLASNAGYAAAIAASAADPTKWQELNEELKLFLKNSNMWKKKQATSSGGAPQKGPFEDILTSLKKIAQRSVNVKGGIDEIFKLFGKNRNIKLDRGFESLFIKGNFNASFAKFLADAEAKTRDLLVRFKNGKAILTDFGLAVEKAFQANSLATFRQELRISMQSIQDQRTAVKVLTENNIGYAEAVKIASNAEAAAAIATASRKKNGKDLADVLKLIRREQKLQLILQGEQEIADKKQSKIQETKDMLEGVREQIREYNKLSKAQEQLSKSNFTLIEQQAILRDPVLITMYLDGLEPELLKAKLKEAVSPEFMQGIFEEGFNNAMAVFSANEEKLDIELRIKTKDDEGILRKAQKDIAAISFRIDDLEAELTRLEIKEEEISSIYDKRIEALEEIKSINDDLADQQDKQLTIADALSQGDISAAAKAAQDLRASQAARSIDMQTEALEKSREIELAALRSANGKSRAEIEKIIKDLQMEIFEIEESRLEPAQRRVDLATEEKDELVQSFTVLGRTKLEWDSVASKITSAKVQSDLYKGSIEASIGMVNDLATAWSTVKPTNPVIPFPETPKSEAVLAAEAAAAKEAEDAKKDKEEDKKKPEPKPKPRTPAAAPQLTEREVIEQSDRDYEKRVAEQGQKRDEIKYEIKKLEEKIQTLDLTKALLDSDLRKARASLRLDPKNTSIARAVSRLEDRVFANNELDKKQRGPIVLQIAAFQNRLSQLASGGFVSGPGTPTSDSIPALLSDGEYVIKAASVNKFGKGFLDNINAGKLPGYKKGGMINADRIDDARNRARAKKAKEWEEKVFKDGLTSKELKKERELVARQESEARKQSALNKVRSDARRLESQQAAADAQRQANPTILDKIMNFGSTIDRSLEFGAKLSPLVGMAKEGIDITKSLFNLGSGKANADDYLVLGLGALNFVPGGGIVSKGAKVAKKAQSATAGFSKIEANLSPSEFTDAYARKNRKRPIAFEGQIPKQDFSALSNSGIKVIPTTPQGLLEEAISGSSSIAKRIKLNAMLNNFKNNKIGKNETRLLDNMGSALVPNSDGLYNLDGLAMVIRSLSGDKAASKIVNSRTSQLLDSIEKNKINNYQTLPGGGGKDIADPSKISAIHSTSHAITRDKDGNIILRPAGEYLSNTSRGSVHFSLEDTVKSHLYGQWANTNKKIVSPLADMMKNNGMPYNINSTDTWWMRNPGESLKISNAAVVSPYTDLAKYTEELVQRGLFTPKPNSMMPPEMVVDKFNKEVLHMLPIGPAGQSTDFWDDLALKAAKELVGTNTTPRRLEQWSLNDADFESSLRNLADSLKVRRGIHSQSPVEGLEQYGLGSLDRLDSIAAMRFAALKGQIQGRIGYRGNFDAENMLAMGGMVKTPKREPAPVQMAGGGIVPKYFNAGGMVNKYAKGGDVVPAMLTPGEFVMSKYAVDSFGADNLKAINNGAYSSDSVYNYSINVNVQTGANANDIARNVMTEIRRIDSQKIRGNRF